MTKPNVWGLWCVGGVSTGVSSGPNPASRGSGVSAGVSTGVSSGPDMEKMLAMFIPNLKSVSMLPHSGHGYQQPPYEPITFEQYEKRKNEFKPIDYKSVKGNIPSGSKFCSSDNCEL